MESARNMLTGLKLGSDMLVDSDHDEKQQDTAIITPADSMEESDLEPLADDFDAMRARFMPENPDLETEVEETSTWTIENWTKLPKRTLGPVFQAGGHPWRILFFPAGNNAAESVSFYLEHAYGDDNPAPEGFYACVQFMLVLWNPNDPSIFLHHEANHRFTVEEGDWGFTRFAEKNKIFATKFEDRDRPLVESDGAKVTAYVRVLKDPTGVLWHNFLKYVQFHYLRTTILTIPATIRKRKPAWLASATKVQPATSIPFFSHSSSPMRSEKPSTKFQPKANKIPEIAVLGRFRGSFIASKQIPLLSPRKSSHSPSAGSLVRSSSSRTFKSCHVF